VSERRGCRALRFQRSSHRYRSTAPDQAALRMRIKEMAAVRVRYGYFRIYILLRREGWRVGGIGSTGRKGSACGSSGRGDLSARHIGKAAYNRGVRMTAGRWILFRI
jgi:hypothetical protein